MDADPCSSEWRDANTAVSLLTIHVLCGKMRFMKTEVIKPDVEKHFSAMERMTNVWIDRKVIPYLIQLLDKIQARIKHKVTFKEGNGTWFLSIDNEKRSLWLDEAGQARIDSRCNPLYNRILARFPEISEFYDIVADIDEQRGGHGSPGIDFLFSTVKPKFTS